MTRPLDGSLLPAGVRVRFIPNINRLTMHVLKAGPDALGCPCMLLHGFPELAYSWRKVMLALAQAGYYVIAPDQHSYCRTTGWDPAYDRDLASFHIINIVLL